MQLCFAGSGETPWRAPVLQIYLRICQNQPLCAERAVLWEQRIGKAANANSGQSGHNHRGDEMPRCNLARRASLPKSRGDAWGFLQPGRSAAQPLRRQRTTKEQRETDGSSRPSQRKGWQGYTVFCRAGDPDCMADEAGNAFASVHHKIQRLARGQVILIMQLADLIASKS